MEVYKSRPSEDDDIDSLNKSDGSKKKWLIITVVGAIFIGLILFGVLSSRGDPAEEQASATENQTPFEVPSEQVNITDIAYAFGESFSSSANIFTRGLNPEDERKSVYDLSSFGDVSFNSFGSNLMGFQVSKGYAVVLNETEIWVGLKDRPGAASYKHEPASTTIRVMNCAISPDATKVAYSVFNQTTKTASLWVYDVNSNTAEQILDGIDGAPFMWSLDNKKLFLGPNVFGIQTEPMVPTELDMETKETKPLFISDDPGDFGSYNVSPNGDFAAYIHATVDTSRKVNTNPGGYYIGAPYILRHRNLASGQRTDVVNLDTETPPTSMVYDQTSSKLYWPQGPSLFEYDIGSMQTTEVYNTTEEDIAVVYAVSDKVALIGTELPDKTYAFYSVDLRARDKTKILETSEATSALGLMAE